MSEWLRSFFEKYPQERSKLEAAGVTDEHAYDRLSVSLEDGLRRRAEAERIQLLHKFRLDDATIFEALRLFPPDLLDTEVTRLVLSRRLTFVLWSNGVERIADLFPLGREGLNKLLGMSDRLCLLLAASLVSYFKDGIERSASGVPLEDGPRGNPNQSSTDNDSSLKEESADRALEHAIRKLRLMAGRSRLGRDFTQLSDRSVVNSATGGSAANPALTSQRRAKSSESGIGTCSKDSQFDAEKVTLTFERIQVRLRERVKVHQRSFASLDLPRRVLNALAEQGVVTLGDFQQFSNVAELRRLPNVGWSTVHVLLSALSEALSEEVSSHHVPEMRAFEAFRQRDYLFALLHRNQEKTNRSIGNARVSTRLLNWLRQHGVTTVGHLFKFESSKNLLKTERFGKRCLSELTSIVEDTLSSEFSDVTDDVEVPSAAGESYTKSGLDLSSYDRAFHAAFAALDSRQQQVIELRMGLTDNNPRTLDETGSVLGITRERVRQIENRAVAAFAKSDGGGAIANHVGIAMESGRRPLEAVALHVLSKFLPDLIHEVDCRKFEYVINKLLGIDLHLHGISGTFVFLPYTTSQWRDLCLRSRAFFRTAQHDNMDRDSLKVLVIAQLPYQSDDYGDYFWDLVSEGALFTPDGRYIGHDSSVDERVRLVLEESACPLHYRDVTERIRQMRGEADERSVHNSLGSLAHLFGRGIYGLAKHLPFTDEHSALRVARVCEEIVGRAPLRQWTSRELLAECKKCSTDGVERLTDYSLTFLLRLYAKEMVDLNRNVWVSQNYDTSGGRIDIRQAVMSILEREGRPLTIGAIRERLLVDRGLSEHFQIHPRLPLVRLGPSVWGLLDRDTDLSVNDLETIESEVVKLLSARGRALHESCLIECFRDRNLLGNLFTSVDLVKSVLAESTKVKTNSEGYFYLSSWSQSCAPSVSDVLKSMISATKIVSRAEFLESFSQTIGQDVTLQRLRQMCRSIGYQVVNLDVGDQIAFQRFPPKRGSNG